MVLNANALDMKVVLNVETVVQPYVWTLVFIFIIITKTTEEVYRNKKTVHLFFINNFQNKQYFVAI